jgi:hypothetical protein
VVTKLVVAALLLIIFFFRFAGSAAAADKLVFDSTNHYLGACQLTNTSEWELPQALAVTTFEVWYNWEAGETDLPVTVYYNGEEFAKFVATRASCDPYQKKWCNADFAINKSFPAGKYSTKISNSRQCLKPGGTGAIRLYEAESLLPPPVATPPAIPAAVTPPPVVKETTAAPVCPCNNTIALTAVASSLLSASLVFVLLKIIKH